MSIDLFKSLKDFFQGGVATGKSTVSNMFRELGVPVIDADAMARRIVEPGRKAWKAIR